MPKTGLKRLRPDRERRGKRGGRLRSIAIAILRHKRLLIAVPIILAALLVVVAILAGNALERTIRTALEEHLTTMRDASVAALELWMESEQDFAAAWARAEGLADEVEALAAVAVAADDPHAAVLASPTHQQVLQTLRPATENGEYDGFVIVDASGRIIASDPQRQLVGEQLTVTGLATLDQVLDGHSVVLRPYRVADLIEGVQPHSQDSDQFAIPVSRVMLAAAPVHKDGKVIAVLAFRIDPAQDFTDILSVPRTGDTGGTYALNRDGYMLNRSRHLDELRSLRFVPRDSPDTAYAIRLRDPGGDITAGHRSDTAIQDQPLTHMAGQVAAGNEGFNVQGYRDYRGIPVVGAWTWLDDYDLGVASEMDRAEAYRIAHQARTAFLALICLLVGMSGIIFGATWAMRSLLHRIDQVVQLGQYKIVDRIGEGATGSVYLARHSMLQRPTALKILKPDALSRENIARFEQEVKMTSKLTHPNTVEIYDYGRSPDGTFYYAMEYIRGITIDKLINMEGAVPPARIIFILRQVCGSLEEAHDAGLVHRDIKPPNIMVCQRGMLSDVVKVLDFGLVKDVGTDMHLTQSDIVGGTPPYIAPERLRDPKLVDPRSDLFSIGAIAYAMLAGQEIFSGDSPMEVCSRVLSESPPLPSLVLGGTSPSPQLEAVIMRCLVRNTAKRFQSSADLAEALNAIDDAGEWGPLQARAWWAANQQRILGAQDWDEVSESA